MTETRLRELYEQALAARGAGERERCVTPEGMLALIRREGSEDERLATLDHIMSCAACSREFELLRAIEQAGAAGVVAAVVGLEDVGHPPGADVVPLRPRARAPWQRFVPLALAASLLLAVGIGVLGRARGPGAEDVMRGGDVAVTLLAPAEARSGAPITFAWRPVPDATRYELEVLDARTNVVFSTSTTDTTATLPAAHGLVPGAEYRWWVRASDAAGAQRSSPMRSLRVRSE